jgi:hypothetical protein
VIGPESERLERLRWDTLDNALAELRLCRSAAELTECAGELALSGCAADAAALGLFAGGIWTPWLRVGDVSLLESVAPLPRAPVKMDDPPTLEQQVIRWGRADIHHLPASGGRLMVVAAVGSGRTARGLLHVVGTALDVEIVATYANAVGSVWELINVRRRAQEQCDVLTKLRGALGECVKPPIELVDAALDSRGSLTAFLGRQPDSTTVCPRLTARQREVLDLMMAGLSNAEIAEHLTIGVIDIAALQVTIAMQNANHAIARDHRSRDI